MKSKLLTALILGCALTGLGNSTANAQTNKFVFGGYLDWTYTVYEAGRKPSTFEAFHFNPIFLYQIEDNLMASAEVEWEHSGSEINLEFAQIDYIWNDYVTFTLGKFLVPFGVFNQRLHPTWISRVPGRPLSNSHVVPTGWAETGIMASGAVGIGENGGRVNYAFYVANGLEGSVGADMRKLRKGDARDKNNSNKAVGGRIGVVPAAGIEFGISGYTDKYDDVADPVLNLNMIGADAEFHHEDYFELRGEYNQVDQELAPGQYAVKRGYYAQAALKLSVTDEDILMPVELAVRFSGQNFPGEMNDIYEVTPTVNYYFGTTSVLRLGFTMNGEKTGYKMVNNQFTALFSKGF